MANYIFSPPTVEEGPAGAHRLFQFYRIHRGITIIKTDGQYVQVRYPAEDDLRTYSEVYLGGRKHVVNDATKAALIAANVGVTESNFVAE